MRLGYQPSMSSMKITKTAVLASLICVLIFTFLYIFLVEKINFKQNDDWVHDRTVSRFLVGDFTLEPVIGSTFYVQGFVGLVFSLLFGVQKLPVLTYFVSLLNFFIFVKILNRFYKLDCYTSVILSLIIFFNPLHFYLSLGFMIENYLLFFVLLSLYFYLQFDKSLDWKQLILSNLFLAGSFYVKQFGIAVGVVYLIDLLTKRRLKVALIQFIVSLALILSYYLTFPRTPVMLQKGIDFSKVINAYSGALFLSQWYVYLMSFTLSLFILLILYSFRQMKNRLNFVLAGILSVIVF